MQTSEFKILIWLPSPMGDAILCTPALRAIRRHFEPARITLFANPMARQVLSPSPFNDEWIELENSSAFAASRRLRGRGFTHAVLFKNSLGSAISVFMAGIPQRIGYAREGRSPLLTTRLYPAKLPNGKFKPLSMIDYYLRVAATLGADTADRTVELAVEPKDHAAMLAKMPEAAQPVGPVVILVPGGAFGPSKCWPSANYARTANRLIENRGATVFVSVACTAAESRIAEQICSESRNRLINLAQRPLTLGQLKALYSIADLVITNDTGPRHIAIALGRKVITLFGPNDPTWTDTGYENEIQIVGEAPCAPCAKPRCGKSEHLCMEAISVEMVCDAARQLLDELDHPRLLKASPKFKEISPSFLVAGEFEPAFRRLGLTSLDAIFGFKSGLSLTKPDLAKHRSRVSFDIELPATGRTTTAFLKRYDRPPILNQLSNWVAFRKRASFALIEVETARRLAAMGIPTPRTIAYGDRWAGPFERRSFIVTEKIADAESLERKLPPCVTHPANTADLGQRRRFIAELAAFVKKFHDTGYRHRDLYFAHIFHDSDGHFHLIDLSRAFRPALFSQRYRVKDIAQLHYSAPGGAFSNTDRLRFYLSYSGSKKLGREDKAFIKKVMAKAKRMARHDQRHGRRAPFAEAAV